MRFLIAALIGIGFAFILSLWKRTPRTIAMEDVHSWFIKHEPRFRHTNALRVTVFDAGVQSGARLIQGFFDQQTNEFLHSRTVVVDELDDTLKRLHASDKVVVYE